MNTLRIFVFLRSYTAEFPCSDLTKLVVFRSWPILSLDSVLLFHSPARKVIQVFLFFSSFLFFQDRVSLCNSTSGHGTHFVDHAGLELEEIYLPVGIKGVGTNILLYSNFYDKYSFSFFLKQNLFLDLLVLFYVYKYFAMLTCMSVYHVCLVFIEVNIGHGDWSCESSCGCWGSNPGLQEQTFLTTEAPLHPIYSLLLNSELRSFLVDLTKTGNR